MKRIHPIFNLSKKSQVSESPSGGSQEPDHRKKTSGKLSPLDSSSYVPSNKESTPTDIHLLPDDSKRLSRKIPVEIEEDEEDILHFDISNTKSDIPTDCVSLPLDEVNNQPGPSTRSNTVPDPIKLSFPNRPERFILEQTSSLSSDEELYVKPGVRFIKKFQKGVSDVKNSFSFNWIKKSKKSERQEPLDPKEKSKEDFSSSPTSVSNVVKSYVSAGDEPESADSNCVQFVNEQAKNEFIAIQMEDDDESETDESGDQNTKWALNLKLENEVDYNTRPGPSRLNKRQKPDTVQQPELKVTNEEKADDADESDGSLKRARNGRFERLKNNPVLNWIKRSKVSKSRTRSDTLSNQSNGLVNERSDDFSECPSKESGVANAQHAAVLSISTSIRIHRLVRRLKRKRKIETEQDMAHPQPHDITPEHTVPSLCDANEDDTTPQLTTSQPTDHRDVIIDIDMDSDEDNEDNCCMQGLQRCACGAKEKACVMCSFMERQKRKWDDWNPDLNNPFFMCLAESKLAGLKEAVKPNRGICFR